MWEGQPVTVETGEALQAANHGKPFWDGGFQSAVCHLEVKQTLRLSVLHEDEASAPPLTLKHDY